MKPKKAKRERRDKKRRNKDKCYEKKDRKKEKRKHSPTTSTSSASDSGSEEERIVRISKNEDEFLTDTTTKIRDIYFQYLKRKVEENYKNYWLKNMNNEQHETVSMKVEHKALVACMQPKIYQQAMIKIISDITRCTERKQLYPEIVLNPETTSIEDSDEEELEIRIKEEPKVERLVTYHDNGITPTLKVFPPAASQMVPPAALPVFQPATARVLQLAASPAGQPEAPRVVQIAAPPACQPGAPRILQPIAPPAAQPAARRVLQPPAPPTVPPAAPRVLQPAVPTTVQPAAPRVLQPVNKTIVHNTQAMKPVSRVQPQQQKESKDLNKHVTQKQITSQKEVDEEELVRILEGDEDSIGEQLKKAGEGQVEPINVRIEKLKHLFGVEDSASDDEEMRVEASPEPEPQEKGRVKEDSIWMYEKNIHLYKLHQECNPGVSKEELGKLFGDEDSDEEVTDKDYNTSCIERIIPWVVKYLMPYYKSRRIIGRLVFKSLARRVSEHIVSVVQYPREEKVQYMVKSFFKNKKTYLTESDVWCVDVSMLQ